MYDEDLIGAQQMHDAALVRSARLQIQVAVLELSVRPLEDEAAVQLRAALGVHAPARAALRRLRGLTAESDGRLGERRLSAVPSLPLPPRDAA